MSTTPFEREILDHHCFGSGPFPRPGELYYRTVARFTELGLLETDADGNIRGTEGCRVYMKALDAVPFPVMRWVMPDSRDNGSSQP